MANNGVLVVPFDTDMTDPAAVLAAARYIPQSDLPGPFCDLDYDNVLYPVGAGVDADEFIYKGVEQILTDPTDLLHNWGFRAPSRNSPLLTATLRRGDGVEADFACDARGYLPRAEVLTWAGASAVTVARLWGTAGEQLGVERMQGAVVNTVGPNSSWDPATRTMTLQRVATLDDGDVLFLDLLPAGRRYMYQYERIEQIESVPLGYFSIQDRPTYANLLSSSQTATSRLMFTNTAGNTGIRFRPGTTGAGCRVVGLSIREVLTANAVQTTTANQPPLDLAVSPLRIGASASKSLVATLPAAINGARILTADETGVAVATANLASGAYTVQDANALRERVVLAADTPEADVEAVRRNMMRAWRLGAAA